MIGTERCPNCDRLTDLLRQAEEALRDISRGENYSNAVAAAIESGDSLRFQTEFATWMQHHSRTALAAIDAARKEGLLS